MKSLFGMYSPSIAWHFPRHKSYSLVGKIPHLSIVPGAVVQDNTSHCPVLHIHKPAPRHDLPQREVVAVHAAHSIHHNDRCLRMGASNMNMAAAMILDRVVNRLRIAGDVMALRLRKWSRERKFRLLTWKLEVDT